MQKFIAREKYEFKNGAIGYRPGGPMDSCKHLLPIEDVSK